MCIRDSLLGFVNDPIFGQTEANVFLQPKPAFYPFYYGAAGDTLVGLDSLVLTLKYLTSWGDTNQTQTLNVYRVVDQTFSDSVFKPLDIRQQPTLGAVIGSRVIDIRRLKDTVQLANGKEPLVNQIRIKLDNAFANEFFSRSSLTVSPKNALHSDSLFRKYFNGFAVKAGGSADALMFLNLADGATRLEVRCV